MPSAAPHPDDSDLVAYAAGHLAAPERGPVESHLAGCPTCADRLDALLDGAAPDPLVEELRAARGTTGDAVDFHALACARNRPGSAAVCGYFRQAADQLAAAHARGVVHGDLKLSDLLLDGPGTVRVAGFAGRPGDPADDIRALGRCLLAMLTGRPSGTGRRGAGPDAALHPALARVLGRMTSEEPSRRFRSMAEVSAVLAKLAAPERRSLWRRLFG